MITTIVHKYAVRVHQQMRNLPLLAGFFGTTDVLDGTGAVDSLRYFVRTLRRRRSRSPREVSISLRKRRGCMEHSISG